MPLTRLELPTSTYQLSNIINPLSSCFKFVTASQCGNQLAFYCHLKTKKWRNLEQHSIEIHSHLAQWVEQLTWGHGFESGWWTHFFSSKNQYFCVQIFFLKFSIDNTVTWHYKHASKRDLSELKTWNLGTRIYWLLIDSCFGSFITSCWKHWCREKTVNSCCTFLSKPRGQTVVNHLSGGFNPTLNQTFFQFLDRFEGRFFSTRDHNCLNFCFVTCRQVHIAS